VTNGNFGGPPSGGSGPGFDAGGGFGGQPPQGGGFGALPPQGGGGPRLAVADFNAAMDVFKTLMGRLVPSGILGGFLVMSLGSLVANIPLWVAQYLRISALQQLGISDYATAARSNVLAGVVGYWLGGGLMILVFAARLGLVRAMRMVILEGPGSVNGVGDVLRIALARFGPNLAITIVYFIAVAAGSICCIAPGLAVAVVLYPATYLVATERDFTGSFSMSVEWIQRHPGALLGTIGFVLAIMLVLGCCNCGFSGMLGSRSGPMSMLYALVFGWLHGEVFSVFSMTLIGSGCIAADQADAAGQQQTRSVGPF
jgi:hypothetical protein